LPEVLLYPIARGNWIFIDRIAHLENGVHGTLCLNGYVAR